MPPPPPVPSPYLVEVFMFVALHTRGFTGKAQTK
jgi:hypothetical protein